jgi:GDPmannose 4,6-dehydratase
LALSWALSARARRDWGHAKDYVEMQWLMLQQDHPEDSVVATGQQHSFRDFVSAAAAERGMEPPGPGNDLAGRQRSPSRKWCGR